MERERITLSVSPAGATTAMAQAAEKVADDEDACWDIKKRGFCPRGQSCQYCKKTAAKAAASKGAQMEAQMQAAMMNNPLMMMMMGNMMGAMMANGGGGDDDDACWDMKKKGACPRGSKCKYCRKAAMK